MIARSDVSIQFDQALGRKIRECRLSSGMSQRAVLAALMCEGVDLDERQYRKIEKGERTVYPIELALLLQILGLDIVEFAKHIFATSSCHGVF